MPARIVSNRVEKDVVLLTDPDAEFVSLVRHGANRMPFRVIKTQKGGGEKSVIMAVHSILLPIGVKLENLAAKAGRQWLSEARVDKSEAHDGYTKLEQTPLKSFDPASLQMVSLDDGALAIVGKLQKDAPTEGVLTIGTDVAKGLSLDSPLDQPVNAELSAEVMAQMAPSFGQLLDMEVGSMMNVIYGTLQQSSADSKSRKATILKAVDSFKAFMTTGLDAIGAAKVERKTPAVVGSPEGGLKSMFKTKEEFVDAVGAVVDQKLKTFGDAIKKELAPVAPAAPAADVPAAVKTEPNIADMISAAVATALKPFTEKLETVSAKTEKLGAQLGTDPAGTEDQDPAPPAKKSDDLPADGKKPSVFSGLLSGKALTRQEVAATY